MKNLYKVVTFLFLLTATNGCKPDPDIYPTKIIPIPGYIKPESAESTGDYYFKGTLNGQALNWQETNGLDGWVTGSASATSNDQGEITGSLTALLTDSKELKPQLGVEIGMFHALPNDDKSAVFKAFVKTGSWNFGTDHDAVDAKFVSITYLDSQGNLYSSAKGAQTGSINIASITSVPAEIGREEGLKIKLTFSCTLYPIEGTGASLTLTNAEATVWLENGL
ncbi:MAG TPA: hypothetical protein VK609_21565 [Mucilaginibacter sp.]|nr:hypothetical protein [Mucilaginibacter sp.]